jgi:hypothetical protein
MTRLVVFPAVCFLACIPVAASAADSKAATPAIALARDDQKGQLQVRIDGREALTYCYGGHLDLPHYYPLRSPSGKLLTVEHPDMDPHHRSVWFADTVQIKGGRKVSFYMALYSRVDRKDPKSPLRDRIRHVKFLEQKAAGDEAAIEDQLLWEADLGKTPMLDEFRSLRVVRLGGGEYLLDLTFELKAAYGDVAFVGDAVHYAWPYVRMHQQFCGQKKGLITNSEGGIHEKGTHDKPAHWVDYSNTVDGATEGLAILDAPGCVYPHRWLTREYGTFGPRRIDAQSGKPFTLKQGDSLRQRAGILIHSGDATAGRVKERYQQYSEGKL